MKTSDKTKFRQSKAWKQFRLAVIVSVQGCCELCGTQYKGKRLKMLQVHHLNPDDYFNITTGKFAVLCSSCHDLVERMAIKKSWGEGYYEKCWYNLLWDFMPVQWKEEHRDIANKIMEVVE